MKRRDFITKGAAGAVGMGFAGCGAVKPQKVKLWREQAYFTPRPKGTMPMTELGTTGIKISKFGFGSHIRKDIISSDHIILIVYPPFCKCEINSIFTVFIDSIVKYNVILNIPLTIKKLGGYKKHNPI